MISCYLQRNSPQKSTLRTQPSPQFPTYSLTCSQIHQLKIQYDDIILYSKPITKIMLLGQLVSYHDTTSPSKKPLRIMKIKDSTGICNLQVFPGTQWDLIPQFANKNNGGHQYVTVYGDVKCQGQFRYEIKLTVHSIAAVRDFNTISAHFMETIKDYLKMKVG